ncbi:preprotein translocase subunit SecE [Hymenobacter roseosalivarius]|nr:preprotein translocase subunit SecE [Hymenobacter roseosalivarius]
MQKDRLSGLILKPNPAPDMSKLTNYIRETTEEMRYKVTWPSFEELQKSAGLVLLGSLIFAAIVGAMDLVFNTSLQAFYNSFR